MSEHFIKNIEIKNFKCFENFKAEGFGRVNLIGGKNNVGKTAFMEAVYINVYARNIKNFIGILTVIKSNRDFLNIESEEEIDIKENIEQSNNIYTKSNINITSFKIEDLNGIKKYLFRLKQKEINVNINDFSYETEWIKNINFLDTFGLSYTSISHFYSSIQKKKDEQFLNDTLKKFDNRIESFKIMEYKPYCEIDGKYYEIGELGDGVRHLISIVTILFASKDGYLFIDEIENGIHYTMLDEIWKVILEVSKKLNVQVFATTHSQECIESYARVAKRLEDEGIAMITMARNSNNELKALVWNQKQFFSEMEQNHEVRGW